MLNMQRLSLHELVCLHAILSTTLIDTKSKLGANSGEQCEDPSLFQSLAGPLQYLTFTRPDISYDVHQICLFMHGPMNSHMLALK
ncbi:hypothetical protein LIER_42603 [Lithospermum erythrorhizon]|uniref:Uncharacterized protein n=1 Tax=Lithospermum erythrorhizon TaxID=34254 RepID=A0AAV3NR18_LITER